MLIKCIGALLLFIVWVTGSVSVLQKPTPQSTFHPRSASLDFRCPSYALPSDTPLSLIGEVVRPKGSINTEGQPISYDWRVDGGSIMDGQGTTRVTIRPDKLEANQSQSLRITLEPNNAPPETEIRRTCEIRLVAACKIKKIDEYGGASLRAEEERLDRLAKGVLKPNNDSRIYIVAYAGKESCAWEADWRSRRVKSYMIQKFKIDPNYILTVDGGFRNEFALAIFTSPNSDCGPLPTPSVLASDVKIGDLCEETYRRFQDPK